MSVNKYHGLNEGSMKEKHRNKVHQSVSTELKEVDI